MDSKLTLSRVMDQTRTFFAGLSLRQRLLLIGGAVLVAATLYVFVQMIGSPQYKVLYAGMTPQDTQDIVARLTARNIPYQQSTDGADILVPADKLDSARLEVASQAMPHSGRLGFELFDKPNWAGSDFSEKVNYQRALEAELERTLGTLSEVEAVRVHLVLPAESLYSDNQHAAKASVMVKLRHGRLPEQADTAIRQLVAGAVDRLRPESVVVVDAETNLPLGPGAGGGIAASDLDRDLAKRVVETLEPVVGAQGVRASVHVDYDYSSGEETQETYDPNSAVALSTTRSEEQMGGPAVAGGVPGTSSNLPNAKVSTPAKSSGGGETQSSKSESSTYAVNKLVRHTIQPAGRIRTISAALLIDDAITVEQKGTQRVVNRRKRSPDEMKQIEELARAALGIDAKRGDLLAVENLSFQGMQQEAPAPPSKLERLQRTLKEWTWLIRYLALGALFGSAYLLLLRPVKKQIVAALRELPERARKQLHREASGPLLAPDGSELLEQTGGRDEGDAALKRVSNLKSHLAEKVKNEPAGATRLIQSWLREGGAG